MSELIEKVEPLEEAPKEGGNSGAAVELEFLNEEEDRVVQRLDSETLTLNGDKYKIIEDYREALDLELLEERYSEFLEKYDFIVGDISYDKLRLRGFYEDRNKKVPIDMRISNLEDYLLEYCSFGCKYFVLECLEQKKKYRSKSKRKRDDRKQKNTQRNKKQKNLEKFEKVKKRKERNKKRPQEKENKKSFVKKERAQEQPKKKKAPVQEEKDEKKVRTVKDQKGNTKFQIRRKK